MALGAEVRQGRMGVGGPPYTQGHDHRPLPLQ